MSNLQDPAAELLSALEALVDAIDYRETPEGKRSYAILGSMPPAFHRARALVAQQSVPTGGGKEEGSSSISQSGCTTFGRNETAEPSARGEP